jgi:hypothetical protein
MPHKDPEAGLWHCSAVDSKSNFLARLHEQ